MGAIKEHYEATTCLTCSQPSPPSPIDCYVEEPQLFKDEEPLPRICFNCLAGVEFHCNDCKRCEQ